MGKKIVKNQVLKTPKHISSILYKNSISNNGTNIDYSNKNAIKNVNNSIDKNLTKTPSSNIMNLNISKNKDVQMNNIYRYINTEKNKNDKLKLVLKGSNSIDDAKNRVVNESMRLSNSNNNHNRINLSRIINDFQDKNRKADNDSRNSLYNIIYYKDNEKNSNPSSVGNNQKNSKIGLLSIKKGFINHNNDFLRDLIINNHTSHSKGKNRNFNISKKNNVMPVLPLLNN
jgi:23S rRNA pseudoU1915 N3-methylase RlmH